MPGAKADFGNMHLHHAAAIIRAAPGVEPPPARPFIRVQNGLDGGDRLLGQMIEVSERRLTLHAFQLVVEFEHHLPAPVIAFDKSLAARICGVTTERAGDIGAGRAVVVIACKSQRVDHRKHSRFASEAPA